VPVVFSLVHGREAPRGAPGLVPGDSHAA